MDNPLITTLTVLFFLEKNVEVRVQCQVSFDDETPLIIAQLVLYVTGELVV